jgi:hypothetical protein
MTQSSSKYYRANYRADPWIFRSAVIQDKMDAHCVIEIVADKNVRAPWSQETPWSLGYWSRSGGWLLEFGI